MRLKRFTAGALALSILATLPTAALASGSAASEDTAGYLILGEDLSGNLLYTTAPWASSTDCYTLSVEHGVLTAEKITTLE
ncbi:MAG: hypothetical protein LUG45_10305 [Clostridiales bacterium]|nr:hypothetical protein [Clostridiales bacterium]